MIEIVTVISILIVLAALMFPVFSRALLAAKESKSKSNLQQIYVGLMLYREQHDAKLDYGSAPQMGLPTMLATSAAYLDVVREKSVWRSPLCCHKDAPSGSPDYNRFFTDYSDYLHLDDLWTHYVSRWEGEAIVIADYHSNDRSIDLYYPMENNIRAMGVRLNGSLETRSRRKSISSFESFWNKD